MPAPKDSEKYKLWIERKSKAEMGEKNHFYNKHHTEDTKRKQSKAKEGFVPYNKGKTKENCEGIRKYTEKRKGKPRLDMRGKLNSNWKDGITPLVRQVRSHFLYRQWRDDVFTKDDFICQKCEQRGGTLHAHHIKFFSEIIEQNNIKTFEQAENCSELWNINNGITYCIKCHKKIHKEQALINKIKKERN